jgi:phage terminase small subunit
MNKKITAKQKKFADEYLIDLNATQAAARAGYKDPNFGRQLLTKTNVADYIQKKQALREKRTEITQDKVLKELANIAFANGTDYAKVVKDGETLAVGIVPTDNLTDEQKSAVAGIKQTQFGVEIKLNDKLKALELIGKHLGMFEDKQNNNCDIENLKSLAEMLCNKDDTDTNN